MHALKIALKVLVPVMAFGFLGMELYKLTRGLDSSQLTFRFDVLAMSLVLLAVLFVADAVGWNLILGNLQQRLPWAKAIHIWFYSSLSRYIPGIVWPYLSRIQMCSDHGVDKTTTATSMVLENLLLAGTSLLLSSPLMILYFRLDAQLILGCILLILAGLALVICLGRSKFVLGLVNRYLLPLTIVSCRSLLLLALYYLTFWLVFGCCFLLFCQSILTVDPEQFVHIALAFPVSFAIGFIVSISPGGLGIREGVLYTLLLPLVGSANAALLAVASRVWLMAMELVIALGITVVLSAKRGVQHRKV